MLSGMSTESQRQGLEMGVFLPLISSRRKELRSKEPVTMEDSEVRDEGLISDSESEERGGCRPMRAEAGRQLGHC